jgi:hypothetical protein
MIHGAGGIYLNASCSLLPMEPKNHLVLMCDFSQHLTADILETTYPYSPLHGQWLEGKAAKDSCVEERDA